MERTPSPPRRVRTDKWLTIAVTVALFLALAVPIITGLDHDQATAAGSHVRVVAFSTSLADPPPGYQEGNEARDTLLAVIGNVRNLIMGLLLALATLLLTIAGVRYLVAGGDPGETEKAKSAVKAAAIGYVLAFLAPVIAALLSWVVQTQ